MTERETAEALKARIEELEQEIRVLKQDLIHDKLTGLKTRAFFEEEAKIYFNAVAERHGGERREWFGFRNLSFIFFDIDHFKKINDTHGHQAGDGVLVAVAGKIMEGVRRGDIAARWGGEEMVVALVGANESLALKKAEQIRKSIEMMNVNALPDLSVTISAGVASVERGTTFDEVIKRADQALYKAKESGRNQVITYSELTS